ncbi:hypothetical protein F2P81_001689 [Scophthalmus maximus]|uniref:Protein lifeguard 1-like n=1 Tax=Scophthalmus maximus TaxID=52904 RepID=A0A6A4TNP0_SCOMX|nr:hypothetical protein F2P81_001689 [Scophthalmus maximus]
MDQTSGSSNGGYGPRPPPYSHQDYGEAPYTGMSYQVGTGSVAVVSPPGTYDNMIHPEGEAAGGHQPHGDAPPVYSHGLEDGGFSDAAIRRALVSFALTLFAMQSKWDFTAANGSLWVFAWTLFSFALLCAILRSQYLYIVYACLGTLLFSLYLVFDTQLILGGKHRKYRMSPEEYVFAALNLYLDIATLFLLLLQLIGLCR